MSENALKKISEKVIGVKRRFNFSPRETVTEIEPFEVEIPVRVIFHLVFIASVQLKYTELNSSAPIFFPSAATQKSSSSPSGRFLVLIQRLIPPIGRL